MSIEKGLIPVAFSGTKRFQVVRKLGEGGMGVVYEVLDRERRVHLALKTLLCATAGILLRFKEEFRGFRSLHHPNLVRLGELYEEDGVWFFTMELLEGTDFITYVKQSPSLSSDPVQNRDKTLDRTSICGEYYVLPPADSNRHCGNETKRSASTHLHLLEGESNREASLPETIIESLSPLHTNNQPGLHSAVIPYVTFNEAALCNALLQLTEGLTALHAAGKIHRDIKPSNIFVTKEGRVKLLDYGIAKDISLTAQTITMTQVVGTPLYMAPEQIIGKHIGPAIDWYAVGVVLYEALTGVVPFRGEVSPWQAMEDKQTRLPPPPIELAPDISIELSHLCMKLLAIKPEERADGRDIFECLGELSQVEKGEGNPLFRGSQEQVDLFVGREKELVVMYQVLQEVKTLKRGKAIYIRGESGVGKSALMNHFIAQARKIEPQVVVLAGQCYGDEFVPYNAVDRVIDQLSRYLAHLPKEVAATLLPRHTRLLANTFHVLEHVEAVSDFPEAIVGNHPQDRKNLVNQALRELLTRLADRFFVIMTIDDLQWADSDSLSLLSHLLQPPDCPRLLLIGTVRDMHKDLDTHSFSVLANEDIVNIQLSPLNSKEAKQLVAKLMEQANTKMWVDEEAIAKEAHGYPLFLEQVLQHRLAVVESQVSPDALQLEDAIWARVSSLDDKTRGLLEILSLAAIPLTQRVAVAVAGLKEGEGFERIKVLKRNQLVQAPAGLQNAELIEPYHDYIRRAICRRIPEETKNSYHLRIALALEQGEQQEPEALAYHWREAGDIEKAGHYAFASAEAAENKLAFDKAIAGYEQAIQLQENQGKDVRSVRIKLADVLAKAGRCHEAACVYRAVIMQQEREDTVELRRRAMDQLFRGGHIDEGLIELRKVIASVDLVMPETPEDVFEAFLKEHHILKQRGFSFEVTPSQWTPLPSNHKVDICWTAASGLLFVDLVRGLYFHVLHLLMALETGDLVQIARGLVVEASIVMMLGGAYPSDVLVTARRIPQDSSHREYLQILIALHEAFIHYLNGRWKDACAKCIEADDLVYHSAKGIEWEQATIQQIFCWSLVCLGCFRELSLQIQKQLAKSVGSRDLYGNIGIRLGLPNMIWLIRDNPVRARAEAEAAVSQWSKQIFTQQHLWELIAQVNIDLYQKDYDTAWNRLLKREEENRASGLLHIQFNRILFLELQLRASLGVARARKREKNSFSLEFSLKALRELKKEEVAWAEALARMGEAGVFFLKGKISEAVHLLDAAIVSFDGLDMKLHVAVSRWCRSKLDQSSRAQRAGREAEAYFNSEQVIAPARFISVFVPWF
ncbi:serine/threonine-protein kinase [Pajaroellobacter abortibovis]|uniref:serine/threonine-protein kinase n=1 Tax=Pajaroellobacter abortibovis TaxID=1882918 RepID=UPI0012EBE117|nr:serine/threonine-protein kinase [Pajaroellobacter abortibovis]